MKRPDCFYLVINVKSSPQEDLKFVVITSRYPKLNKELKSGRTCCTPNRNVNECNKAEAKE